MNALSAWEQAWDEWLQQTGDVSELPQAPVSSQLPARIPHERQQWLISARKARRQRLFSLVPERITVLLGPEYLLALLEHVSPSGWSGLRGRDFQRAVLHGLRELIGVEALPIPHLLQVFDYELACLQLREPTLPEIWPETPYPRRSDSCALLTAGPALPEILECLRLRKPLPLRHDTPLQTYLISREWSGFRIEPLSPLLAACLSACQGEQTWEHVMNDLLTTPEALSVGQALLNQALAHWLRRGIVCLSSAAEADILGSLK
jgi:hypothetical protein